jgi:hypothetical protein
VTKDKKGKPVLYVELYKSLYGLLCSALLFYRKLKKELIKYGFTFNPYDPCVCMFHVDDVKLSCKNGWELAKLLLYFKQIYGNSIAVHRGKTFDYLGMYLDYSEKEVFGVSMIPYIDKVHKDFLEEITKSSPCPHN